MKRKRSELDIDFIGGAGTLTKEEELAITAFLKSGKPKQAKKKIIRKSAKTVLKKRQYA